MRAIKKLISILDKIEDAVILVLCVLLLLIGVYALFDSYMVFRHANDTSLLQYKPGYGNADDGAIVGNMVAWLTIDDTNIDYPVMQGANNEEYLNMDPYGEYSMSGSIFLDFRNQADFSDPYSLIYGHHMEGDYMFGSLHEFLDEEYFCEHETAELIVGDTTYDLEIFAVMNVDATEDIIFSPTEYELEDVLSFAEENAVQYRKAAVNELTDGDRIVALSTCQYPDSAQRVVVFAKIK